MARKIIPGVTVRGALIQMGPHKIDRTNWDWSEVDRNPFFTPDARAAKVFGKAAESVRPLFEDSNSGAVSTVAANCSALPRPN